MVNENGHIVLDSRTNRVLATGQPFDGYFVGPVARQRFRGTGTVIKLGRHAGGACVPPVIEQALLRVGTVGSRAQKMKAIRPQRHSKIREERVVKSVSELLVGHCSVVAVALLRTQPSFGLLKGFASVLGLPFKVGGVEVPIAE